jgi:hypothetical protein
MLCYKPNGRPAHLVYPVKRANGRLIGYTVIERIAAVLEDYGFDGLQLGDGLSSNRLSIENGDFSLPFCAESDIDIPAALMAEGEEAYVARRAWILQNARYEWIQYLSRCWASFYSKLFDTVKKPIMFNIAWTRDSFEALYRYGLDYRKCCIDRAFAAMVEENSATRAITAAEDEGDVDFPLSHRDTFPYEYALMQQDIKLATKGLPQISLMPISDTQEQWDALRHCPTELSRSIIKRYNNFVFRNGRFEACCNAPHYCLSDGIPAADWQWLASQEAVRLPTPDFVDGFVAVTNPDALDADVKQFCARKRYFGSALLGELVMGGLNLGAQVALADVPAFDRAKCLVVTNLNAYTAEQKATLAKCRLPILAVGEDVELPLKKSTHYAGKYLSVAYYGGELALDTAALAAAEQPIPAGPLQNGEIWTEPLQFERVAPAFFQALARAANIGLHADRCEATDVKLCSYICGEDKYILLSNDRHTYYLPEILPATKVREAQALLKGCGYRPQVNEGHIRVRIPPRGVEILKITQ